MSTMRSSSASRTADVDPLAWMALALVAIWSFLVVDPRRRWPRSWRLPRPSESEAEGDVGAASDGVYVVIPARNEAAVVGESLPPHLGQRELRALVLVDDNSTDGTAAAAQMAAGASPTIHVASGTNPPDDWTGKLWALQTGLDALPPEASADDAWILLTDADIGHPPDAMARLLARAASGSYDMVSVMVRLCVDTRWEKFLIPPFVYFFQIMYPFRLVSRDASSVAAAAGGCILIRRGLLERLGGLAAIRGEVIDDVNLARRARAAGGRLWLGHDDDFFSLRGYEGLSGLVDMVARTAFTELRYRYSMVAVTWLSIGAIFVAPPVLAATAFALGNPLAATFALVAWCLEAASIAPVVVHQRVAVAWAFTLPVAALFYAWMTTVSAWRHAVGRGVSWRGRRVSAADAENRAV